MCESCGRCQSACIKTVKGTVLFILPPVGRKGRIFTIERAQRRVLLVVIKEPFGDVVDLVNFWSL
jgi:heterodisulfide reductase subunit C